MFLLKQELSLKLDTGKKLGFFETTRRSMIRTWSVAWKLWMKSFVCSHYSPMLTLRPPCKSTGWIIAEHVSWICQRQVISVQLWMPFCAARHHSPPVDNKKPWIPPANSARLNWIFMCTQRWGKVPQPQVTPLCVSHAQSDRKHGRHWPVSVSWLPFLAAHSSSLTSNMTVAACLSPCLTHLTTCLWACSSGPVHLSTGWWRNSNINRELWATTAFTVC